jgi:catechol O-methyltransferase
MINIPISSFQYNDGREQALIEFIRAQPRSKLQNNPSAVTDAIFDFNKNHTWMMLYSPEKVVESRKILEQMDPKPKVLVELGTYVGSSAVAWGQMLRDLAGADARVYAVELEPAFVAVARELVELAGLRDVVTVCAGASVDVVRRLLRDGALREGALDVLFLDHWERYYVPDLQLCEDLRLFRKGSVVLADNTDMPGAPDYLEYVRSGGREGNVKLETRTVIAPVDGRSPVSAKCLQL